jgi:5'-3' exonuclease
MRYILIDSFNLFFKSKHIASRGSDDWERVGMAHHLMFSGIQNVVRRAGTSEPVHVVMCLEGRSWRKDFYEPYKRNRAVIHQAKTEAELALDKTFFEAYDDLIAFLREKTNVSVLRCPTAEADDLIARFVHLHPEDNHTIVSSDSDFVQLIAPNVQQYNSISGQTITLDGYYDDRGREVKDKDTKEHKKLGDPQYHLFEKCMRGDPGDNVFSAYPGVRTKSTKNRVGLTEAYDDRERRGFTWNNLLLQRWVDHEGVEHRVKDDYERNRILIDLTAQPQTVKDTVDSDIRTGLNKPAVAAVGFALLKFATKYELNKISDAAEQYARWLSAGYAGHLKDQS